jgi:hypothetical protein
MGECVVSLMTIAAGRPKGGHDAVPEKLVERAVVAENLPGHQSKHFSQERENRLWRLSFRQMGEADNVRKTGSLRFGGVPR